MPADTSSRPMSSSAEGVGVKTAVGGVAAGIANPTAGPAASLTRTALSSGQLSSSLSPSSS